MDKEKLIMKVVATGKRELKRNFEIDYGVREYTTATCSFPKKMLDQIKECIKEINELSEIQGVPFKVDVLESGIVRFVCLDDNKKVVKTLVKKGW